MQFIHLCISFCLFGSSLTLRLPRLKQIQIKKVPHNVLTIGVPKEIAFGESRVGQTPDTVKKLVELGFDVFVEKGCGECVDISDSMYEEAGAKVVNRNRAWKSDIVVKVQPPTIPEAKMLNDRTMISFIEPASNPHLVQQFVSQGSTVIAMDCTPRSSEASDLISSQAKLAGYRAMIEASYQFKSIMSHQGPLANGIEYKAARVLIIGAGAAGLFAARTASQLGANVSVYGVRDDMHSDFQGKLMLPCTNLHRSYSSLHPK